MKTIILSDLHLGAKNSRTDLLMKILYERFDLLILNGDIVDDLNFHRFNDEAWKVMLRLREISKQNKLVFVMGNHDFVSYKSPSVSVMLSLLRVDTGVLDFYYLLNVGSKRYLVTHGDIYDDTLCNSWYRDVADWIYNCSQYINTGLAHLLKMSVKHYGGVLYDVKKKAIQRAKEWHFDGTIVSHTHYPDHDNVDGIEYINTGCWVGNECSYVCINDDNISLCYYS